MLRKKTQRVVGALLFGLVLVVVALIGCHDSSLPDEQSAVESQEQITAQSRILYLDVRFTRSTYQLVRATIHDSVFTPVPIIKIYGTHGVRVVSDDNEITFDQYTWMKPINGSVRVPFDDNTAFVEFVRRTGDETSVVGRFSREEILSAAM